MNLYSMQIYQIEQREDSQVIYGNKRLKHQKSDCRGFCEKFYILGGFKSCCICLRSIDFGYISSSTLETVLKVFQQILGNSFPQSFCSAEKCCALRTKSSPGIFFTPFAQFYCLLFPNIIMLIKDVFLQCAVIQN